MFYFAAANKKVLFIVLSIEIDVLAANTVYTVHSTTYTVQQYGQYLL